MKAASKYVSREPGTDGVVAWSEAENATWAFLYRRQERAIRDAACDEFMRGLELLDLARDRIPQLHEVSRVLRRETGWSVAPVPAVIPFDTFFALLANRRFPAATFIRDEQDLDYIQEPDIFHELFGHTPMLTDPHLARFTETCGRLGLAADERDRVAIARLYWFTAEFGLIRRPGGELRIYGGGILSSSGETAYALHGEGPLRLRFDPLEALRTPYRIDIMQPVYFYLEDLAELSALAPRDILALIREARRLGLHPPRFGADGDGVRDMSSRHR